MNVTVRVDSAGVRRALSGLSEATSNRAIVRALDRAVDAGRTEVGRVVRDELNLKLRDVQEVVSVRKARGSSVLDAAITINAKPVPLIQYDAHQLKSGAVTVKVKRGGGRVRVQRAFIAKMKSGHVGIFTRDEKGQGGRSRRLPIHQLFSTSVRQLFKRSSAVARVTKKALEAFNTTALNQIRQALRKRAA